jgi:hypothetical protein
MGTSHPPGSPEGEAAIEEFVLKKRLFLEQRRQGGLSDEEWGTKYDDFLQSEAERLETLMPGILAPLGARLSYRSDSDRRLDELLRLKHPTAEELVEIQSLLQAETPQGYQHICSIAHLVGYLGRGAPKEAVDVLLASAPPPERSQDPCFIRALMTVGPTGYKPILERISSEKDRVRVYIGVMALVAQTIRTDFPVIAGLGKQDEWDESFPTSIRGLRRLAKKWEKWWSANEGKYSLDPETDVLVHRN